jgi:hypothetical protein
MAHRRRLPSSRYRRNKTKVDDQVDIGTEEDRRATLIALAAVVLLGILGYFLAHELSASARLQDCVLSGRSNCAPVEAAR